MMRTSLYSIAQRFIGMREVPGSKDNPQVLAMLKLDAAWPENDEVPWCSAFLNYIAWLLRLPRSKSLRARSWLLIGHAIALDEALVGFDVVILWRGEEPQPGPDEIDAPGHVGVFAGREGDYILILGGNQGDEVNVRRYHKDRLLGIRRLWNDAA